MSHWYQLWKTSTPTAPKGPQVMNTSEEIANLRKDSALWDLKNPRHAEATARLAELYRDLYGDAVEEDPAR